MTLEARLKIWAARVLDDPPSTGECRDLSRLLMEAGAMLSNIADNAGLPDSRALELDLAYRRLRQAGRAVIIMVDTAEAGECTVYRCARGLTAVERVTNKRLLTLLKEVCDE